MDRRDRWDRSRDKLPVCFRIARTLGLHQEDKKIAQEELLKSRKKNKTLCDRRAKRREFQEGDKVLLLLPTDTNKLMIQWKGPYEIKSRCGKGNDYRVEVNKKVKTFHANMLKKYIERADQDGAPQQNLDNSQVMSCDVCTGIIGGNEDLSVNDDEMINTLRRPTAKKEVRSFWGLANYYRAHIPTFAAVAAPLTDLTRKGQPNKIRWGQAQEKAFSSLQDCLLKRPILKLLIHSKLFLLRTDASDFGLGAALMQQHDEKLYPVAYATKKLAPAETKHSTLEKECLGIVWSVTKFRLYLAGKPFILQTDHQPLAYIQ